MTEAEIKGVLNSFIRDRKLDFALFQELYSDLEKIELRLEADGYHALARRTNEVKFNLLVEFERQERENCWFDD